jgi:hypothetical protein
LATARAKEWPDVIRHRTDGIHHRRHVVGQMPELRERAKLPKPTGWISWLPPDVVRGKDLSFSGWGNITHYFTFNT